MAGEGSTLIEKELLENNGTAMAAVPREPRRPSVCLSAVYYNTLIHLEGKRETSGVLSIYKSNVLYQYDCLYDIL